MFKTCCFAHLLACLPAVFLARLQIYVVVSYLHPAPSNKVDRSKHVIPFPIVYHPTVQGKIHYQMHHVRDILRGECLISVPGVGIPFGEVETAQNIKSHGFWYHIPRHRAMPELLGGEYHRDFVNSVLDPGPSTGADADFEKVFVSEVAIQRDWDATKASPLDLR